MAVGLSIAVVCAAVWAGGLGGVELPWRKTQPYLSEPEFVDVSEFGKKQVAQVDRWLEKQLKTAAYPSLNVAIVRKGEVVYSRSLGVEDLKSGKKATTETPFHVASVTKVFTALLAKILHDRGIVDLDQPVIELLPDSVKISKTPAIGATITLRQLASHTSGLPRGIPEQVQSIDGWYQLEPPKLYALLSRVELEYAPGEQEEYSNLAFGLLGHALELAADKPFNELIQELISKPLPLKSTGVPVDGQFKAASGYAGLTRRRKHEHSLRRRLAPSGGLVSSLDDLALFLMTQMEQGTFSTELLEEMHAEIELNDGSMSGNALGWSVRKSPFVGLLLKKNGGRSNCSAWIGFAPEFRVGVVVVTNCGSPEVDDIGYWLLSRSVPNAYRPVAKYGYAKVAPFTGVRWEGKLPIVEVNGAWLALASIDNVPIEEIMDFATGEFGESARKRFSEDLVELLAKMGHAPNWEVMLGVTVDGGRVEQRRVLMTEKNRELVYDGGN